jgi:hypothetical protein
MMADLAGIIVLALLLLLGLVAYGRRNNNVNQQ